MQKYSDKLFTFLDHDGVPWNNNNAENAIKRFASRRKIMGASFTEKGHAGLPVVPEHLPDLPAQERELPAVPAFRPARFGCFVDAALSQKSGSS